jgi:hypothetical protein
MAIRLYNASSLQMREVGFTAYLRIPISRDGERIIRNPELKIFQPKGKWHFSLPFVPYTVRLELPQDNVICLPEEVFLAGIQSESLRPAGFDVQGDSFLVFCVEAQSPQTGLSISQSSWYRMTSEHGREDILWGRPAGIQVHPGREPRKTGGRVRRWRGWRDFETNRTEPVVGYILGYGSLVHPSEFWALMTRFDVMDANKKPFWYRLEGYRLAWNVAMDNMASIPGYKFYVDSASGERPDIAVTFLNIQRAQGATLTALAIPASESMIQHLDERERNYDRIEVAERMYIYIGKKEGCARFAAGSQANKAAISMRYYNKVASGYEAHGKSSIFEPAACPAIQRLDLELRRV